MTDPDPAFQGPPPWVNRDLPRALLRQLEGPLRSARGSLLLTTGTASTSA